MTEDELIRWKNEKDIIIQTFMGGSIVIITTLKFIFIKE